MAANLHETIFQFGKLKQRSKHEHSQHSTAMVWHEMGIRSANQVVIGFQSKFTRALGKAQERGVTKIFSSQDLKFLCFLVSVPWPSGEPRASTPPPFP